MKTYKDFNNVHDYIAYCNENLGGVDLRGADLSGTDLSGVNLGGANLSGADLRCVNLSDADLSGTDLSDANLRCADLSNTDLRAANLSDANLRCADLSDANLSDANLGGADLRGVNLGGANLSGAKYAHDGIVAIKFTVLLNLYNYTVIPFISESGEKYVALGCKCQTVKEWETNFFNNEDEFPDEVCKCTEERKFALRTAIDWLENIAFKF